MLLISQMSGWSSLSFCRKELSFFVAAHELCFTSEPGEKNLCEGKPEMSVIIVAIIVDHRPSLAENRRGRLLDVCSSIQEMVGREKTLALVAQGKPGRLFGAI